MTTYKVLNSNSLIKQLMDGFIYENLDDEQFDWIDDLKNPKDLRVNFRISYQNNSNAGGLKDTPATNKSLK